jgi:penicillin amidase
MATPAIAPMHKPRRSRVRLIFRIVVGLLLLVLVTFAGFGLWLTRATKAALPQLDGNLAVTGLTAPVSVIRDQHGVPHIKASSLPDLFFAQGYVTAQDRLWQMDMSRRAAAGELSEILAPTLFGEGVLRLDKRQRVLGLRAVAEQAANRVSGDEKLYLESYARGVNAFIDSHRDSLPSEFRLLRYQPRPWTITDSFLIGAEIAQELQFYLIQHMWMREKVLAHVGPQLAADLYPNTSWRDHPPTAAPPDFEDNPAEMPEENPDETNDHAAPQKRRRAALEALLPEWLQARVESFDDPLLVPGSNNWVVSGTHTATGKPLLSNDMHLGHQVPSVWYESQLTAPGYDVAGVTFAGMPFIVVGHNQRIGWGFTNVGPITYDLYIENFNDRGEYQTPTGWQQPQLRRETIKVRGGEAVTIDVPITRHGPVISDILPGETRKLALKWTAYDPSVMEIPFFAVDRAQNWQEFRQAIARMGIPSQNAVYGDIDGHIGYITTGKVPTRRQPSQGIPVSGADDANEWTGYIPFEQMPSTFDPPSGIIATANGRITPDGYPFQLGIEWVSGERTQRIYRVLQQDKKFTAADMLALQTDVSSAFDTMLAQRFVYAVDHNNNASDKARKAADILRAWNGLVDANSAAPTIIAHSRRQLQRMMLEPKLGGAPDKPLVPTGWRTYRWEMENVWLENTIRRQAKAWLPSKYASFDELLAAAVEQAVTAKGVPGDLNKWAWAEQVALDLEHPLFGRIPFFNRKAGPGRSPQSGNGNTVKQVGSSFGPSQRLTVDFANLDATNLNITTGESGNIFSPYFMDHWPAWYHGSTFTLPFTDPAIQSQKAHALSLQPANRKGHARSVPLRTKFGDYGLICLTSPAKPTTSNWLLGRGALVAVS